MSNRTILHVNSSGRYQDSITREVSENLVAELAKQMPELEVKQRDVAKGLPFIDEAWIHANFTDPEQRTEQHRQTLSQSDQLVAELQEADILVIAAPIYNFSIPAVLKAWIDQIARARVTFRYTETGPEGLLTTRKAYIVAASGGVPIGSDMDFATRYLQQVLAFVGINDVTVVNATEADVKSLAVSVVDKESESLTV